jgi:Phosphoribosyl transferase domain
VPVQTAWQALEVLTGWGGAGQGTSTTGTVKLDRLYKVPVAGRHIILVEDIVDTGITADRLMSYLKEQGPASVSLVTLLDKEERRKIPIKADYVGFKARSLSPSPPPPFFLGCSFPPSFFWVGEEVGPGRVILEPCLRPILLWKCSDSNDGIRVAHLVHATIKP